MFIMSLYIAFGIGYNLAKSYKLDALSGAQLAVCSLLLTLTPELIDKRIHASDDKSRRSWIICDDDCFYFIRRDFKVL